MTHTETDEATGNQNLGLSATEISLPYYERFLSTVELEHMRFDADGLRMTIPQSAGQFISQRIPHSHVTELCCGVGSLAIALALTDKQVTAIDNNQQRLRLAEQNARCFGVDHLIEFTLQDCRQFFSLREDSAIFFDPPWGGSARRLSTFKLDDFGFDISPLLSTLTVSHSYVAMKVPFNFDFNELKKISDKWSFTAVTHQSLTQLDSQEKRPLFWLAEHSI